MVQLFPGILTQTTRTLRSRFQEKPLKSIPAKFSRWPERTLNDGATFPRYSNVDNENPSLTISGSSLHEPESARTNPRTQPLTHEPTNARTHSRTHEPPTDPRTHEPPSGAHELPNPRTHGPPPTPESSHEPRPSPGHDPLYTAGPKSIKIHVKTLKIYSALAPWLLGGGRNAL